MNKFPEFFYPNTLQDIISHLRNDKNLNEDALRNLNAYFYGNIFIAVLCMFLISLLIGYTLLLLLLAIVIGIILARYKLIQKSLKEVIPYTIGDVKKGNITSKKETGIAIYQYTNSNGDTLDKELRFNSSFEEFILPEGPVDVYFHQGNSIPFIENRFRSSCLNKRRIDDAINTHDDLSGY